MTPFKMLLLTAIGTGILGIAGFLTWLARTFLPKMYDASQTRDKAFFDEFKKIGDAVGKLPDFVRSHETTSQEFSRQTGELKQEMVLLRQEIVNDRWNKVQKDLEDLKKK